jgi:hypothetical protein
MTPQANFLVLAPIAQGREPDLRKLLASMNRRPGLADPRNPILPFGEFDRLHVARLVILEDPTFGDLVAYGRVPPEPPKSLAFLGDCDGPADEFLADLVQRAEQGLRQIFSHCDGFTVDVDLLSWMKEREQPPAAAYVNWVGRTVRQIREESALRDALVAYLKSDAAAITEDEPRSLHAELIAFVDAQRRSGQIVLTDPAPTPLGWQLRNLFHCVGVPLLLLVVSPLLLLYLPVFAYQLRSRETRDPEIVPRPDAAHVRKLAELEDHDVTNQFSAIGSVKPGLFRRWTVSFLAWLLDYGARHVYNRGYLTRVQTIHFARWVFLDGKQRLFFASNYDGSLESYMDDFINKVAWGLNLVFSNGVGYPRTRWLIQDGAKDEQKFKFYIRRHELATEVWYKAYPGLSAVDLERNTKIRAGVERSSMTDAEIREWLSLL